MMRARFLWILWLIAALVLYVFTDSMTGLILFLVSLLIPILMVLINLVPKKEIECNLKLADTASKQEFVEGIFKVSNKSIFPISSINAEIKDTNLLTSLSSKRSALFSIAPNSTSDIPFIYKSDLCGKVQLSIENITTSDIFGLSKKSIPVKSLENIVVYPDTFAPAIVTDSKFGVDIESNKYSPYKPGSDPSETFAIREYQRGDSVKNIHWKLSQKLDDVLIKESSLPIETSYMLLFETVNADYDPVDLDTLAEAYVSIAQVMVHEGLQFSLGWKDSNSGLLTQKRVSSFEDLIVQIPQLLSIQTTTSGDSSMDLYLKSVDSKFTKLLYFTSDDEIDVQKIVNSAPYVSVFVCSTDKNFETFYDENIFITAFSAENYIEKLKQVIV